MAIEQVIEQAADKLMKAVEVYGPKATDLILETGRVAAAQNILSSATAVVIGGIIVWVGTRLALRWFQTANEITKEHGERWREDKEIKFIIGGGLVSVGAGIAGLIALVGFIGLIDLTSWVGLWRPEIFLAAKLLKL